MTLRTFSILTLTFSAGIAEASGAGEPNQDPGFWGLQTTGRGRLVDAAPTPPLDLAPPAPLPAADLRVEHSKERSWYGAQLIISDVLSAGMVAGGYATAAGGQSCTGLLCSLGPAVAGAGLGSLGIAGLTIVAPITHLAHGRGIAAAESVALRIVLPLLAGFITAQAVPERVDFYGTGNSNAPMVAAAIALGVGAIIDDAFLSTEER